MRKILLILLFSSIWSAVKSQAYADYLGEGISFTIYSDHYVFESAPEIRGTADYEIFDFKSFTVNLPLTVKDFTVKNFMDFCFVLDRKQVIIIKSPYIISTEQKDLLMEPTLEHLKTTFIPSHHEILLRNGLITEKERKDPYEKIFFKRKTRLIVKDGFQILLLNILPDNIDVFLKMVSSFNLTE